AVWQWTHLPRTLLVVGGGVIGCEFASALTALGTKVTVVEAAPALLGGFDADLATGLLRCFKKDGITILAGTTVSGLVRSASGVTVQLAGLNSGDWSGDAVLVAAGRVPALDGLIGADFGLTLNARGGLTVDEHLQTTAAGVYAAGDAVGGLQLAHAAAEMGEIAVFNLLGGKRVFAPGNIPWAMFTEPEAGSVGLGEQQARAQGLPVCCGKVPVRTLGRAHATGEIEGLCKVVANRDDGRLLGVHLLGGRATDLIAAGALALQAQLTVSQLADAVQAHPTFAEGLREAAREALRHRNDG
ncbi:MAG TPA: NAD(P)/FAD-dependent oxidoreductase, partial [bacterium]|nr:NAD(P)/FAD-dependent oxidoreductase [bacterium]